MRFRILGPLEVHEQGRQVTVPTTRARTLLAVLLLHANRVVSVQELAERLWDEEPPAKVRAAVQLNVQRLRKALDDRTVGRIHTRSGGYLMEVDADDLDLLSFRRLVVRAGDTSALPERAELLRRALELWRGPPLAGLAPEPPLSDEVSRLLEEQMAAQEAWVETRLTLGQHADVIPMLTMMTRQSLRRERAWAQLMLALYRSGRQADALETYRRLYRLLDEEQGVQPSGPVRDLHQRILTADPGLDVRPVSAPPTRPTPRQLPPGTAEFTGRRTSIELLDGLLRSGDPPPAVTISVITGAPGIGKTSLALHWAHRVADAFEDGQLFVDLRGYDPAGRAVSPDEVLNGFLDALGVAPECLPDTLAGRVDLYRSMLADRRMLVVLDNARDVEQVRPLLPGGRRCVVLVTSRDRLSGLVTSEGARPVGLDLLTIAEARDLLTGRLGRQRVTAEPAAVDDIIAASGRLPLALAVVAGRAAAHPRFTLAALAAELVHDRAELDAFTGRDAGVDIRAVFSCSYAALNAATARLFRLLGSSAGRDFAVSSTASLAGVEVRQAQRMLDVLAGAHLIVEAAPGRYAFHDLLRAYAAELAGRDEHDDERRAAARRLLDHYARTAHAGAMLLYPLRDPIRPVPARPAVVEEELSTHEQALAWFTREHGNLLAAAELASATGHHTHAWQLAWALQEYLDPRGHWHDIAVVQRVAVRAARQLEDRPAQAIAHRCLAAARARQRRYADARRHLDLALDLSDEDPTERAHTYRTYAWVAEQQGGHREALCYAKRSLLLFRRAGHRVGQANALNDIGWQSAQLADHRQALEYCRRALSLQLELGNRHGQAATWEALGYAHQHLRQLDDAISAYLNALELYRELGVRYHEAETLLELGDTYHATGDGAAARAAWRDAHVILGELGHPDTDRISDRLDAVLATDALPDGIPDQKRRQREGLVDHAGGDE